MDCKEILEAELLFFILICPIISTPTGRLELSKKKSEIGKKNRLAKKENIEALKMSKRFLTEEKPYKDNT
ncbi:MAG: hypothetical protein WBI82_08035 [Sphaerochaeta sp.]